MNLESALVNYLDHYMQDCYTAMPALILNVKNEGELRVDVQPVTNRIYNDGTIVEHPPVLSVPVIMPATRTSAVLMPVKQGDTCLLIWCQRDITNFKSGTDVAHDPDSPRWQSLNDAVAIIGLFPFTTNPNRPDQHKLPHSVDDLTLVHNLNTENECEMRLTPEGNLQVNVKASIFNCPIYAKEDVHVDGNVFVPNGDVVASDISLVDHTHQYTDNGNTLVTRKPM